MQKSQDRRDKQHAGLGALFLGLGLLLIAFAALTTRNGWPVALFAPAYLLGALFTLIGGRAIFRGIRGR